jgi:hypothetical protein
LVCSSRGRVLTIWAIGWLPRASASALEKTHFEADLNEIAQKPRNQKVRERQKSRERTQKNKKKSESCFACRVGENFSTEPKKKKEAERGRWVFGMGYVYTTWN